VDRESDRRVFILGSEILVQRATTCLRSWVRIGIGDKVRVSVNYDFIEFLLQFVACTAYSV